MRKFEAMILREARQVFALPRLRQKDIQEWSYGKIKPRTDEEVRLLPGLKVSVAIKRSLLDGK